MSMFWQPHQIRFTKQQLKEFILPNLDELREGNYPVAQTGYNRDHKSLIAPFIIAADIAIEIDDRLKQIPKRTYIEQYYVKGIDIYSIAQREHISVYSLNRELNKMIMYLSGWKRKRIDYNHWLLLRRIGPTGVFLKE